MHTRLTGNFKLSVGACVRLFGSGPVIYWKLVWGVPRIMLDYSWDILQTLFSHKLVSQFFCFFVFFFVTKSFGVGRECMCS